MNDSLFNAELRDCARINEIQEQRAPSLKTKYRARQAYPACDQGRLGRL